MTTTIRGSDNFDSSPNRSRVQLRGANGYGSTNTVVKRWLTVVANVGADITYADSATLGMSCTINASGVYAVSYSGQFSGATAIIITNTNANLNTVPLDSDVLSAGTIGAANQAGQTSWTGYLPAGTIVRSRVYGAVSAGTSTWADQFTIQRVA